MTEDVVCIAHVLYSIVRNARRKKYAGVIRKSPDLKFTRKRKWNPSIFNRFSINCLKWVSLNSFIGGPYPSPEVANTIFAKVVFENIFWPFQNGWLVFRYQIDPLESQKKISEKPLRPKSYCGPFGNTKPFGYLISSYQSGNGIRVFQISAFNHPYSHFLSRRPRWNVFPKIILGPHVLQTTSFQLKRHQIRKNRPEGWWAAKTGEIQMPSMLDIAALIPLAVTIRRDSGRIKEPRRKRNDSDNHLESKTRWNDRYHSGK